MSPSAPHLAGAGFGTIGHRLNIQLKGTIFQSLPVNAGHGLRFSLRPDGQPRPARH